MARGAFDSKLGFIFAAVGSAVGLGNLWRFPYLVSTNGGAAFMFIYLALLFVIGIPALMAELSIGRKSRRNAIDAFNKDGLTKKWTVVGFLGLITAILLLSYYSVIAGWALRYLFASFTGPFFGNETGYFSDISFGPGAILFHLAFMAITVGILFRGVGKGIEGANLIMMPVLFIAVIGLAIYGNVQAGAGAGREFYLNPDFSAVTTGTISEAAGQTFFSIGLGLGTMLTYSSYLERKGNLQATGMTIGMADTGVAILAGFMVFPLLFSLGLDSLVNPENGGSAGGLFIVIPSAFAAIGGWLGTAMAVVFFLALTFAALSSALSLLEVPVSAVIDKTGWGRMRSVAVVGLVVYILGVPSALSSKFLGVMDSFVSNILLLTGGLLLSIFVGWVRPHYLDELTHEHDGGIEWSRYFRPVIKYVLPVTLSVLLVLGIINFFQSL
jgi:NSS family neurotransmitter:Na+ symporter